MSATHDADIVVNVSGDAQPVDRKSFGLITLATDEVGGGFPAVGDRRLYRSPDDMNADSDLTAVAKAELAGFFNQKVRPEAVAVAKVAPATIDADLTSLLANHSDGFAYTTTTRTKADLLKLAAWGLLNKRLVGYQSSDADLKAGTLGNVCEVPQSLANGFGFGFYHDDDDDPLALGMMTRGLAVNPDQKTTVWYHKPLIGVPKCEGVDPTDKDLIEEDGGNLFLPLKGVPVTGPGKLFNGEFIDTLITREWWRARSSERIAQLQIDMSDRGEKIPFDNVGMGMIAGKIEAVGRIGVGAKHFRDGSVRVIIPDISTVDPADVVARNTTIYAEAITTGAAKKITLNTGVLAVAA